MSDGEDKMLPPSVSVDQKARAPWAYFKERSDLLVHEPGIAGSKFPDLVSLRGMGRRVYWRFEKRDGKSAWYVLERYGP